MEAKFRMLVQMVQRDMEAFKAAANSLQQQVSAQALEIAGLKAQHAQMAGQQQPVVSAAASEVIGQHPLTGAPVTREMVEKDPKLKLRMAFSESDA
jgi:ABC-type uncharacterized transport system substrate-binding protein